MKFKRRQFEGERFFIAFRDKNWNELAPPLRNLKAQDYNSASRKFTRRKV
jgi:hypothetical protein